MSDDDDGEQTSRDGDDEESDLDLDQLFDALPSEATETDLDEVVSIEDLEEDSSLLEEAVFEARSEGQREAFDPEDVENEDEGPLSERGATDIDFGGIGDIEANESQQTQETRKPGIGRFDGLLSNVDPGESSQDLDELLENLSTKASRSGTADQGDGIQNNVSPAQSGVDGVPSDGAIRFEADQSELMAASDTLFMAPRDGHRNQDACQPLFSLYNVADTNVLLISLQDSSEERLDSFFDHQHTQPANLAVVTGADSVRSTTKTRSGSDSGDGSNISVKAVSDPGDLTRLGITISNILQSWAGNGHDTLVCFDSVSALLQYADLQRVFRFLHVLQGRLDEVRARTHYHLEPEAHDTRTVGTLQPLFDGTLRWADDGILTYE